MAIDVKTQIIHHKDSGLAWLIKHELVEDTAVEDEAAKEIKKRIKEMRG